MGFKVLVIDQDPKAIGFEYAAYYEVVDTTDFEGALIVAQKYNIIGSMTISSDIAVPTVCYINQTLGLPNQGDKVSELAYDKVLMREAFTKGNVSSPEFTYYEQGKQLENLRIDVQNMLINHPVIAKPADSSGSRGVSKVKTLSELDEAINKAMSFSKNGKIIVEKFIEGIEIGAQSFSRNGNMEVCFVHNDKVTNNMVPIGHSFPLTLSSEVKKNVEDECVKALSSLGINNGPSNIDIIVDRNNTPYIIEIGARIGATKLPELVNYYTGIDLIKHTIYLASGENVPIEKGFEVPIAVEMLSFAESGLVESIEDYSDLIKKYDPLELNLDLEIGSQINEITSGIDVYGYVFCKGKDAKEAEINCTLFIDELKNKINIL